MKFHYLALATLCAVRLLAQPIVIRTSTLIDGKGGVQRDVNVVVEGTRIVRIEAAGKSKTTYDLSGMTLMPGWIDTHVHPSWHWDKNNRLFEGQETPDQEMLYTAANAQATL